MATSPVESASEPYPVPVPERVVASPSGTPIWVTVVVALCCLGLGLATSLLARGKPVVAATLASCPSAAPAPPPKAEPDALTRASQGESRAMEGLAAIPTVERTVAQASALSRGRAVEKRLALEHLKKALSAEPASPELLKRLMQLAQDGDTAREAIAMAAELGSREGCDLLYELSTTKTTPIEMSMLAAQYLETKELRAKASPALSLVLELKDATTCEQRQAILERSLEVGDKRLVRHVVPLTRKTGCGEKKSEDCHPCLRSENQKLIRDALQKTQARKAPAF